MTIPISTERMQGLAVGFVGGGFMARVHSRAARAAGARLLGVVSSSRERSAAAVADYGIERAYDDVAAMVNDPEIDVIHVCTPNATHLQFALAAIEAGKHVICEKPLATSLADADRLVEAAGVQGVVATIPFVYRFHPMVREARARLAQGDAGRLLSVTGSYMQDWLLEEQDSNWRVAAETGGPSRAFADIGSHLVDLVEFISGDRIAAVSAATSTVHPIRSEGQTVRTEDIAALTVRFASGALGSFLVSQVAAGRKNRLLVEFAGSQMSIEFNQEEPEALWIGRRESNMALWRDVNNLDPSAARLSLVPAGHPMGYQDAFNAFVADTYAAIRGTVPDGLPVFRDGLRTVLITEAVMAAAETRTWVEVPDAQSAVSFEFSDVQR